MISSHLSMTTYWRAKKMIILWTRYALMIWPRLNNGTRIPVVVIPIWPQSFRRKGQSQMQCKCHLIHQDSHSRELYRKTNRSFWKRNRKMINGSSIMPFSRMTKTFWFLIAWMQKIVRLDCIWTYDKVCSPKELKIMDIMSTMGWGLLSKPITSTIKTQPSSVPKSISIKWLISITWFREILSPNNLQKLIGIQKF